MTDLALSRILESQADGADLSDDGLLFIAFAGCSLDDHPTKTNWVQEAGGLPEYICQIAKALKRSGHDTSDAIKLAVGSVKNWASGQKHVNADTRAKAQAAVTEWEAKKASAHAKSATKKVAASGPYDESEFISLCADTFNTDVVQNAFRAQLAEHMFPKVTSKYDPERAYPRDYSYINQLWSNFIIATGDLDGDGDTDYYKIPYSVDPDNQQTVTFGTPVEVQQVWVTTEGGKVDGSDDLSAKDLDDTDMDDLMDLSAPASNFLRLTVPAPATSPLDKFLALAAQKRGDNPSSADTSGPYADPKNKKYPVDTAARVRSAWSYINQGDNASVYPLNGVTLASVKSKIKAAAKRLGVEISDSGE